MNSTGHRFCSVSSLKYICCHLFKIKDGPTAASQCHFCRGQVIGVLLCWKSNARHTESSERKKTLGDYCKMNSTREKKKVDDSSFPPSHHLIPVNLSQVVSFISSSRDHILKETRGPSNQAFFSVSTDGFKAEIRSKFYRTVQKSMDMK